MNGAEGSKKVSVTLRASRMFSLGGPSFGPRGPALLQILACFLDDFAVFAGVEAKHTMIIEDAVLGAVEKAIDAAVGSLAENVSDLDAVLAIYALHRAIWERSILSSLTRVREVINGQLSGVAQQPDTLL